jgi:integrase
MPKITNPRNNIVDEFEIKKIFNAVGDEPKLLFAVAIAYKTGARISEIIQLRAKDFSEQEGLWIVSIPTLKQRYKIHGSPPRRELPITQDKIYKIIIKPFLDKNKDSPNPLVYPETRHTLKSKLKRRYPDVYFHWFRHGASTRFSRTLDIFELQSAMGWKDLRMANNYVHNRNISQRLRGKL